MADVSETGVSAGLSFCTGLPHPEKMITKPKSIRNNGILLFITTDYSDFSPYPIPPPIGGGSKGGG